MLFTKSESNLSKDINELKIICDKIQAHLDRKERVSTIKIEIDAELDNNKKREKEEKFFNENYAFYSIVIPNLKKKMVDFSGWTISRKNTKLQEMIDKWIRENGAKCREYLDYKKIPTLRKPQHSPTSPAGENTQNSPTIMHGGSSDDCIFLKAHFARRNRVGDIGKASILEEINFYWMIPGLNEYASSKKFKELFIDEKIQELGKKIQAWEDSIINNCPEYYKDAPTLYSPRSSVATITRTPLSRSSSIDTIVKGGASKTVKPKVKKTIKSKVKKPIKSKVKKPIKSKSKSKK